MERRRQSVVITTNTRQLKGSRAKIYLLLVFGDAFNPFGEHFVGCRGLSSDLLDVRV